MSGLLTTHYYECMHCGACNNVLVRDPEEMLLVTCAICGGAHHLRKWIVTKVTEVVPAKLNVIAY